MVKHRAGSQPALSSPVIDFLTSIYIILLIIFKNAPQRNVEEIKVHLQDRNNRFPTWKTITAGNRYVFLYDKKCIGHLTYQDDTGFPSVSGL